MRSDSHEMISTIEQQTRSPEATGQDISPASDHGYVVGVDIGGTNLRLALADMTGKVVARSSSSTADSRSADVVIELIRSGVADLLRQASVPGSSLRAIAAGAPGVTDVDAGIVIATSYLMGWRDVPLRSLLEASLGVPAAVDNDVNLAAIGESWAGAAKGTKDFVFLAIGTGIGAGIILNGVPFRGMGWAAGEIGYMLVPGVSNEPADRGKPGALEGMIGGEGIKNQWQGLWSEGSTALPKDLTATEIFDGALAGDPLAKKILDQSTRILAYAIYNMTLVLNCPLFVLGGGVGLHPALCEATQNVLEQWSARAHLHLTRSTLGADAQLMGAIYLALETANSRSILSVSGTATGE
jgi:glucokinase